MTIDINTVEIQINEDICIEKQMNAYIEEHKKKLSRVAIAEKIHARAMEEYRIRKAEATATAAAAADAKTLFERATEAVNQAEKMVCEARMCCGISD